MSDAAKVSVVYQGGHDAVDVYDPEGSVVAQNVKQGDSIEVSEDVAKSLLEQVDNWKKAEVKSKAAKGND